MQAEVKNEQVELPGQISTEVVLPVLSNRVATQYSLDFGNEHAEPEGNPDSVTRFDLFKSPACLVTVVLLGALMAYGVADSLPLGDSYVAGYPFGLLALAGVCMAGIVWVINGTSEIPPLVSAGLMLVAGVVGAAVAHPALLRANALTAAAAVQQVEYVRVSKNRFDPVEGDWPSIEMIGRAHWLMLSGEVRRTIPIRRGGLGFYQADLSGIRFELEMSKMNGGTG